MSKIELTEEQKQQHREHIKRINLAYQNVEAVLQDYNRANAERWTGTVIPAFEQCEAALESGNTFAEEVAESLPDWSNLYDRWGSHWMTCELKEEFEPPSDLEFELIIDSDFVHLSHGLDEDDEGNEDDEDDEDNEEIEEELEGEPDEDDDALREKVSELEATIRSLCIAGNTSRASFVEAMSELPEHLRQA